MNNKAATLSTAMTSAIAQSKENYPSHVMNMGCISNNKENRNIKNRKPRTASGECVSSYDLKHNSHTMPATTTAANTNHSYEMCQNNS
jgi:hypothetical protein